jgi:hypothetical protein
MSAERDTTRIVRSWLRTDEHESADRVLDNVLALLDATPQHRSWRPVRRIADMNLFAKLATVAATVLVVVVVGMNLFPRGSSGPVSPGPTTTPSPTPSPSPSPSPSPTEPAFVPAGKLAVGQRHAVTVEGIRMTFTVPSADWVSNGEWGIDLPPPADAKGAGLIMWPDTPVGVFADPCSSTKGPDLGTSIPDLAAAVASIPGTDLVSGPTDVTVGGHPAKKIVIRVREDIGCEPNQFYLWYAPRPDYARFATLKGTTYRTWIIDVDGTPVWIDAETFKGASPDPGRQVQQVIDSIQFG